MYDKLGTGFKELREAAGFTQSQVANYLGVDQSYVSKFEKNERQFSLDLLTKALTLFGCTLETLVDHDSTFSPIPVAMRAGELRDEDLDAVATMNRLALNLRYMEKLLGGD